MDIVNTNELLEKCPKCVNRDGETIGLMPIMDNTWSPFDIPDKKCPRCGIVYRYEETNAK